MQAFGGREQVVTREQCRQALDTVFASVGGTLSRVLVLPPDITRLNSGAGELTAGVYTRLAPTCSVDIMPALGTHAPMTEPEIRTLFGSEIPISRFLVHDWRTGLRRLGTIPGSRLAEWSGGRVDYPVHVELNERLFQGYDLILSIGQVVPHEVVGMANYTKNVCVGAGGRDLINKSHFLGAVCDMERIMGRADTPVRRLFNHAVGTYMHDLPISYLLTVMEQDADGRNLMRGLFAGSDEDTFLAAAALSQELNIDLLEKPLDKVVVYLDPDEFRSTWLGNKAVYRTRMALADDGELLILAPGLRSFGEDRGIDRLIRRYGYRGTPHTLDAVEHDEELRDNLSAAAHLVHGSSEGRFRITYCPGDGMGLDEVRGVGYEAMAMDEARALYDPDVLRNGFNRTARGEDVFFIRNPALGLWALREKFRPGSV